MKISKKYGVMWEHQNYLGNNKKEYKLEQIHYKENINLNVFKKNVPLKMIKIILIFSVFSDCCSAYIGPGMGVGAILGILAVLVVILLTFIAIIFYPIKNFIKKITSKKKNNEN